MCIKSVVFDFGYQFSKKPGRGTATFCKKYKYQGGDDEPLGPIPPELQPIFDKLNEVIEKNSDYKLNSCLINKYEGNKAWLPEHSDDEPWIHPTSQIFTISIGGTRNILFKNKNMSGEEHNVSCPTNSLYTMSKASQNTFRHRMDIDENADNIVRYSLTFRRVHWSYMNSTYALGDSNFGKIKFGEKRGQIGKATPGTRDFAAKVEDIDPVKCMSYQNVILMCGTNNLKELQSNSSVEDDIRSIYKLYKLKISQIRELNSKCKILICPVLPSLDRDLNSKIGFFNSLLRSDLSHSNLSVSIVQGFRQFVDPATGLLRRDLHNGEPRDILHLGRDSGVPLLVRLIKLCIFSLKKRGNKMAGGPTYANALRGPSIPA